MSKKHTYEHIQQYITKQGDTLLSKEYKNNLTKLKIQCSRGHIYGMAGANYQKGQRCPQCYYNSKKLSYEQVQNYIAEQGDILLSKEYKSSREKLKIQCSQGHMFKMSYGSYQQGQRCPECCNNNKKLKYEQVQQYITEQGDVLLSKEYKKSSDKLKLQCSQGHIFGMSYNSYQQGCRCPECYNEKRGQYHIHTYNGVKSYIEKQGIEMLSTEYKNAHDKLKLKCPEGHLFETNFNNFKNGRRCSKCSGNKRLTNQEIIKTLQFCESIRETKEHQIEVKCAYCGKGYIPKRNNLLSRVYYVNDNTNTEYRLYCSQGCKDNCPIYGQVLYPKGYKPATSREVQPQLRQLVFERDNYTCQKCGGHKNKLEIGLHCHHIYPLNENPVESADVDACETLCADCHKGIHQNVAGCGYGEMRCSE